MTNIQKNESLNFYIENSDIQNESPKWEAFGDFGPFWYSHRMTISSNYKWRIGFDVTTHSTDVGLIAIDDIIIEVDKACPPKGFCDFEVNYF